MAGDIPLECFFLAIAMSRGGGILKDEKVLPSAFVDFSTPFGP